MILLTAGTASAASLAADNASDPVYDDGIQDNDNGGTGFLGFDVNPNPNTNGAGAFVGNSTLNGASPSGGINVDNEAFGLYANTGSTSEAIRPFDGSLSVGQTFSVDFDTGFVNPGASVGVQLRTAGGANRFAFTFVGGGATYLVTDSGVQTTTVPFTDDGLNLSFTLTGADTYSFTVDSNDQTAPTSQTLTGTLAGTGGIDQVRVFNTNAGNLGANDLFFNSLAVTGGVTAVPEPLTALGGTALIGLVVLRRRTHPAA